MGVLEGPVILKPNDKWRPTFLNRDLLEIFFKVHVNYNCFQQMVWSMKWVWLFLVALLGGGRRFTVAHVISVSLAAGFIVWGDIPITR